MAREPHVISCDKENCIVCHSWLVEQQQLWGWVWFQLVINGNAEDRENHTLQDF